MDEQTDDFLMIEIERLTLEGSLGLLDHLSALYKLRDRSMIGGLWSACIWSDHLEPPELMQKVEDMQTF